MTTSMNEGTHFFIKNIPLKFYSQKGWSWLCVRGELETGTDCYILTPTSSDHSSTSFAFCLGCSIGGHWGPKLVLTPLASYLQQTQAVCVLVIFLFDIHLLPLIYTDASLDSLVVGQYVAKRKLVFVSRTEIRQNLQCIDGALEIYLLSQKL